MTNLALVLLTFFAVPTALITEGGQWVAGIVLAGWVGYFATSN